MTTVAGGGIRFVRFSGDHPRRHHLRHKSNQLSFRTWATAQGSALSGTSPPTFYELLGITTRDGLEEVKKAYKRMARKYHPDVSPPECAAEHTRLFIEVQEAYETLSDPYRRAEYDKQLARGLTRLAFTGRGKPFDPEMEARAEWRNIWQDQLSELQRRSEMKENLSDENLSWAARMRRKRAAGASID